VQVKNSSDEEKKTPPANPQGTDTNKPDPGKKGPVSQRKIAANRRNSQKSTGPKTLQGKAHSRKNAFKDGLFTMEYEVLTKTDNPEDYRKLLRALRLAWQPRDILEDLEVQAEAAARWRDKRAWLNENASVYAQRWAIHEKEEENRRKMTPLLKLLNTAQKEIATNGDMSRETEEKIFMNEFNREQWNFAQENISSRPSDAEQDEEGLTKEQLLNVVAIAIRIIEEELENQNNFLYDLSALPEEGQQLRNLRARAAILREIRRSTESLTRLKLRPDNLVRHMGPV
jgi:hypothetical protein